MLSSLKTPVYKRKSKLHDLYKMPFAQRTSCSSHSPSPLPTSTMSLHTTPLHTDPLLQCLPPLLPPPFPAHLEDPAQIPPSLQDWPSPSSLSLIFYHQCLCVQIPHWTEDFLRVKNHTAFRFRAPVPGRQGFYLYFRLELTNIIPHTSNKNRSFPISMCLLQQVPHNW